MGGVIDPGRGGDVFVANPSLAVVPESRFVINIDSLATPTRLIDLLPANTNFLAPDNVEKFLADMDRDHETRVLGQKIVEALAVIDRQLFLRGISHIARAIENFVEDEPYTIIIDGIGGSGRFMVSELWPYLSRKPVVTITSSYLKKSTIQGDQCEHIHPAHKFVILEDVAYSGTKVFTLKVLLQMRDIPNHQILTALVGISKSALARLSQDADCHNMTAWVRIPSLQDILTKEEFVKLHSLFFENPDFYGLLSGLFYGDFLSLTYYRIPDRFYEPLLRSHRQHGYPDCPLAPHAPHYLLDDTSASINHPYEKLKDKVDVLDTATLESGLDPQHIPLIDGKHIIAEESVTSGDMAHALLGGATLAVGAGPQLVEEQVDDHSLTAAVTQPWSIDDFAIGVHSTIGFHGIARSSVMRNLTR